MISLRRSSERGHFDHGWLKTFHTFSFADYLDSSWMGFRSLRVINEDVVAPGQGFATHSHRDMEIITYIVSGELEHKDSMGSGSVIRRGDVQYMSAGSGVTHSEFNHSTSNPVHLLQIWILPNEKSATPRYDQKFISDEEKKNKLRLIVSSDGSDNSIAIRQNTKIFASELDAGKNLEFTLESQRSAWIQIIQGEIDVNGTSASAGDGVIVSEESQIRLSARHDSELLLFELQ